jgi:HEPN domain-containing protein
MFCLFAVHLSTEKLLKALWVRDNEENIPPFSHNLDLIANQTNYNFSNEEIDLLRVANAWNIDARYQDYKDNFYKRSTKEYVQIKINEINSLRKCLLKELQEKK